MNQSTYAFLRHPLSLLMYDNQLLQLEYYVEYITEVISLNGILPVQ